MCVCACVCARARALVRWCFASFCGLLLTSTDGSVPSVCVVSFRVARASNTALGVHVGLEALIGHLTISHAPVPLPVGVPHRQRLCACIVWLRDCVKQNKKQSDSTDDETDKEKLHYKESRGERQTGRGASWWLGRQTDRDGQSGCFSGCGGFLLACEDLGGEVRLIIPRLPFFFFFLKWRSVCSLVPK